MTHNSVKNQKKQTQKWQEMMELVDKGIKQVIILV